MEDYLDFGFGNTELDTYGSPDYGLGDGEVTLIATAKDKAAKSGQTTLFSILDYVFKYGAQAADILVKTGVIKNKNVYALGAGDINESALANLLAANGGALPTSRSASVTATGSVSLSKFLQDNVVPISIIGAIGVITYIITRPSEPRPKRRRY